MDLFAHLELTNGAVDAPRASACSEGLHLYFGYKESVAAGLREVRNQAGLYVHGEKVNIDTRGDGGFVIAPPTSVKGVGAYKWRTAPLSSSNTLPALPAWLMAFVNDQGINGAHKTSTVDPEKEVRSEPL